MTVSDMLNSLNTTLAATVEVYDEDSVLGPDEYEWTVGGNDTLIYMSNGYPNGAYRLPQDVAERTIDVWEMDFSESCPVLRIFVYD